MLMPSIRSKPTASYRSKCAKTRKGLGAALLIATVEDVVDVASALSTRNTRHHQ